MSGNGDGGGGVGGVMGGDHNDVGEARGEKARGLDLERGIDWGREAEKSDLGFEIVDLALELLLGLVGFLVALLARAGVTCVVVLLARYAPHHLRLRVRRIHLRFRRVMVVVVSPH